MATFFSRRGIAAALVPLPCLLGITSPSAQTSQRKETFVAFAVNMSSVAQPVGSTEMIGPR